MRRVYWFLDVSRGDLQGGIPPNANRSVQPGVPIASQPCVGDGDGVKTDEIRRFENHRPLKLTGSSIRPQRVGCPREFLASLVGPGRIRPHLEEGRNAGAHPQRRRMRGSGKTEDFKPATFRGFRNVAENSGEPLS
jgi:hypothetical protein